MGAKPKKINRYLLEIYASTCNCPPESVREKMKIQIGVLLILLFMSSVIVSADVKNKLVLEYFYYPPCPCGPGHEHEATEADQVVMKISGQYEDQVRIEYIDVTTTEASDLLKQYNITKIPTIVLNREYQISGEEITWENLKLVIDGYLTGSYVPPGKTGTFSITAPLIILSGLVDGVNPCAFALLIFFLSFLYSVHKTRQDIFRIGAVYVLSLFGTYSAIGLGLLRGVTFFGVEHMFAQVGVILITLLGLIDIKQSLRPGGFSLKFPEKAFPKVRSLAERASIPAASVLGGLVGLCEFPCSGGIYIGILGLLAIQATYWGGLAYLVLYNVMFTLPLIAILLLGSNRRILARMSRWNIGKRRRMKLISGIFMIVIGLITWYWLAA